MQTDPIADLLTRIRNAILVRQAYVAIPFSKQKHTILNELKNEGYILNVALDGEGLSKSLVVNLSTPGQNAKISEIKRISKPGRRIYIKVDDIPYVKSGRGEVLISTSRGIMTGRAARKARLGGELICRVY